MLDWLRRPARQPLVVEVAGQSLPLVIRRLGNARRITMRLAPDGKELRISMPQWGREADAVTFARMQSAWVARQLARHAPAAPLAHGASLPFRGQPLRLHHTPGATRRLKIAEGALHVGGAEESLPSRLKRWLQAEARALFAQDLAHYCAAIQRPVPPFALSSPQRRWGSCSANGTIRLNWRLVMAPDAVRRSVVAHEVAHLVHFDHSPRFHALLARLFEGDVEAANRWLKAHGRGLYAPFG